MNSKIKIRNKRQLILRKKAFIEITDQLKKSKIPFFLYGGVLLGFIREKNFIKWDWDIELGFKPENIRKYWKKILKILSENNFNIIEVDSNNLKIKFTKYVHPNITAFEINGFRYDFLKEEYIRKKINIPKVFLQKFDKISIFNRSYKCPKNSKKFLEIMYGDWKTKKKSEKKESYLNKDFYRNNNWNYYVLISRIKKKLFSIFA
jgi:phosphorylcholine metabolism protein LicD